MSQPAADQPGQPYRPEQHQPSKAPTRQLPRVRLVLHHDPLLDLMFVVRTIMELTRLCREEATHKMWEAYHGGRSILLVTSRERAEL